MQTITSLKQGSMFWWCETSLVSMITRNVNLSTMFWKRLWVRSSAILEGGVLVLILAMKSVENIVWRRLCSHCHVFCPERRVMFSCSSGIHSCWRQACLCNSQSDIQPSFIAATSLWAFACWSGDEIAKAKTKASICKTGGVAHQPKQKRTCTIDHFIISSCEATFVFCCLVMPDESQLISSWCDVVHPPCVFYSWEESTCLVVARHFKSCIEENSMRRTADKVLHVRLHDFRRCCHEWCCSQVHVSEIHGCVAHEPKKEDM